MNHQDLYKIKNNFKNRSKNFKNKCQQKRNENFQNGRIISISPIAVIDTEKENISTSNSNNNNDTSKRNNILSKIEKQKAYCAKYIEWKREKERRKLEDKLIQKKPFYTAISKSANTADNKKLLKTALAPENYKFSQKCIVPVSAVPPKKSDKLAFKPNNKIVNNFVAPLPPIIRKTLKKQSTTTVIKIPILPKDNLPLKSSIKPTATTTKNIINIKPIESTTKAIKQKNKLAQPISKLKTLPNLVNLKTLPNLIKLKPPPTGIKLNSNTIVQTPVENAQHPFQSVFTSTQRKKSININDVTSPDELIESTISPIDFINNNNVEDKLLINLNVTENYNNWPSPIQPRKNSVTSNLNYVSPYVSTSRGKVSAKKEKQKRESCYLLENTSPGEENINIRRMKEAVRRFYQLLNDETERLENLCSIWNEYISENNILLNDNGGIDMINAALGQTKLLITKKFKQFRDLIEKCENYAIKNKNKYFKNNNDIDDNNEKPIYPEDLEGFWSMVNIQIEDIDKRFDNINKLKNNNWIDLLDDIKPEKVKKLRPSSIACKKHKKPIKPSHKMDSYLKQLIIEGKKKNANKNKDQVNNDDIILVTKRKSTNNIQRQSITNKGNTPLRRSSSRISKLSIQPNKENSKKSTTPKNNETPRRNTRSEWRCINLLKSENLLSNFETTTTPVQKPPRKSILKTPGTLKKHHNVIFNEALDYKSPETQQSLITKTNSSTKKRKNKRSLTLRSRKLLVDPDEKIIIPSTNGGFLHKY